MRILALEHPVGTAQAGGAEPFLREEAERVWKLYREGTVREIYFRADRREAVLMMEARDAAEATAILSMLPLVREGLIRFDVIPLEPYSGFERLFNPAAS